MSTSTALDIAHRADVSKSLRDQWDQSLLQTIRANVAPDAPQQQFDLFLEVCARYQLNPITGEAYLAKFSSRDGGGNRYTIMVSAAGFRSLANRHADYRGTESDVVRQFDTFKVRHTKDGVEVHHEYELGYDDFPGKPAGHNNPATSDAPAPAVPAASEENAEERMLRRRGRIIGAWAIVHREGRRSAFFFAPWAEYAPNPVARAWKSNPSSMIKKCAVATALRDTYSLSGLYSEAEMEHLRQAALEGQDVDDGGLWGGEDELGERIRGLVGSINELRPGAYRPAKIKMLLDGASDLEREAFADELERKLVNVGGKVPEPKAEEPEEEIADAVVVEPEGATA